LNGGDGYQNKLAVTVTVTPGVAVDPGHARCFFLSCQPPPESRQAVTAGWKTYTGGDDPACEAHNAV
jgi:hypothetical protein